MQTVPSTVPSSLHSSRRLKRHLPLICATSIALFAGSVQAANQVWSPTPTDTNWTTGTNWVGGAAPGAVNGPSTDNALFNTALATGTFGAGTLGGVLDPILNDALRNIGSITFDTANVGAYVIGVNGGNSLILNNNGNGIGNRQILINAAVTSAQTIAAPILFRAPSSTNGIYGFTNNATSSAATLSVTGTVTNAATARPAILLLDGTNTGTNIFSGVITETGSSQSAPMLIKKGTGTWAISGTNVFSGTSVTSTGSSNGFQVLDGVLSLQNNQALGTSATANQLQVWIGNKSSTYIYNGALTTTQTSTSGGGTLEIANGITLDNGLSLNLWNGGTIRGVGAAATNGRINLDTTAATSATLSTLNAADVFTIGNGTNDFTGGAADTVVRIAGPGTVVIATASTGYLGSISIDAGTLRNGSATNGLGSAGVVSFGSGSTGRLQLGNNLGLTSLTTNNATPTAGLVETGVVGTQTLTLTSAAASSYAGTLQNGTGTLALTKAGAGTLTLSGNSNTYSGATTVSGGTLNVTNSSGSATGTSAVSLGAATLTGAGFITGNVTTVATSVITPGTVTAGNAGSGTLTLGNVTLTAGTNINFGLVSTGPTPNSNNFLSASTLTLPGSGTVVLNLYTPGTATPFAAAGIYNLFQYTTLGGGALASAFSFGTSISGFAPSFATAGGFVQLTLTSTGVVGSWTNNGGIGTGNWNDAANWSGGIPSLPGSSATFAAAPGPVTLDANEAVGGITFNNAVGYTISGGNTLTLDNVGAGATVTALAGTHAINTAVAFNDNVTVATSGGTQVSLAGNITQASGSSALTKTGAGTLVLSGANTYAGGTVVSNGVLDFNSGSALGTGTTLTLGAAATAGTLKYASGNTADVSSLTITVETGGGIIDTNGNAVAFANPIGNGGVGGLTKTGNGTLTLAGANTYTGTTTINAGTVSVGTNANLGPVATGAPLVFTGTGGTLATTASLDLFNGTAGTNDRIITLSGTNGTLAPVTGTILRVGGAITGGGRLLKTDAGQVTILTPVGGQNTFSGGTLISSGTILLGDINAVGTGLGTGAVTFEGGTLSMRYQNAISTPQQGGLVNNLVVNTGFTGTLITATRQDIAGSLTGGGTLNYQTDYVRVNQTGNWSAFTGQINVTGNTNGADFRINNTNGYGTSKINLGTNVNMSVLFNFGAGGLTLAVGEITGVASSFLGGGPTGGRILTWSVGGANTNAQFDGTIRDGGTNGSGTGATAITKVGTGSWTLTGTNTYSGLTTINNGVLAISGGAAIADTGTVVLANVAAATLQVATSETIGALSGGGATGGTVALGGNTLTVGDATALVTYAGAITGTAGSKIVKQGIGTMRFTGVQTYETLETIDGITEVASALGTGTSTVNANAATNFSTSQTLAALNIGAGAVVTLTATPPFAPLAGGSAVVPEPGTIGLLMVGALGVLGRRRRR